jgi:dTDP-4-dehydrorhamnose 3,5-epimerase
MTNYLEKPLIIGGGQLGQGLKEAYPQADMLDFPEIDLSSKESLESVDYSQYTVILNSAAWTQVDVAENPDLHGKVEAINGTGPGYLAEIAKANNIPLVHVSSDYVFDGSKENHQENEEFSPLSVYGATKADGDKAIANVNPGKWFILRSSWVIGKGVSGAAGKGTNFVKIMAGLALKGINPTVAADQYGRQTYVDEMIKAIDFLLTQDAPNGVYNLTNSGPVKSLHEITQYIFEKLGRDPQDVTPIPTDDYYKNQGFEFAGDKYIRTKEDGTVDYVAIRPVHSDLDLSKIQALGFESTDYLVKIDEYLEELKMELA